MFFSLASKALSASPPTPQQSYIDTSTQPRQTTDRHYTHQAAASKTLLFTLYFISSLKDPVKNPLILERVCLPQWRRMREGRHECLSVRKVGHPLILYEGFRKSKLSARQHKSHHLSETKSTRQMKAKQSNNINCARLSLHLNLSRFCPPGWPLRSGGREKTGTLATYTP